MRRQRESALFIQAVSYTHLVKGIIVNDVNDVEKVSSQVDFVFSAVDMTKEEIRAIEEAYAKTETPVVSNNSAHRWTPDVPMVVPEINPEHLCIIDDQKKRLNTERGFIVVKPNCSIQSYTPSPVSYTHLEVYNRQVHIRFRKGDENINKIIEFGFSDDYIEREYELTGISGIYDEVLFVFLPGSDFDFKWFRFET